MPWRSSAVRKRRRIRHCHATWWTESSMSSVSATVPGTEYAETVFYGSRDQRELSRFSLSLYQLGSHNIPLNIDGMWVHMTKTPKMGSVVMQRCHVISSVTVCNRARLKMHWCVLEVTKVDGMANLLEGGIFCAVWSILYRAHEQLRYDAKFNCVTVAMLPSTRRYFLWAPDTAIAVEINLFTLLPMNFCLWT